VKFASRASSAVLYSVLVLAGCFSKGTKDPSVQVGKGDVSQIVALSGTVKPLKETMISIPYSGYLRRLYVEVGKKVRKGDPLVAFSQNVTNVGGEDLYPLRAAYDGIVSQILKSEGDYIVQGGADARVLKYEDRSAMFIDSDVPESEIAKIRLQQNARVRLNAVPGREFQGKIVQIFQAAREAENSWDRKGGSFPVRIQITDPSIEVMTGLSAVVEILVAERKGVVRIPQEYLDRKGPDFVVYRKAGGDDVKVEVGLKSESFVEITSGLNEGETIYYPKSQSEEDDD
jgi:multidrug efflux pump subunit AcrA (membrane-fusion protein)